uniref:Zona pellucida sperm-binding protein 3 n=1 Tax=Erpetoichthys calabaricus TaxID=27687 RepID=A0A8C4X9N3_ERPCA
MLNDLWRFHLQNSLPQHLLLHCNKETGIQFPGDSCLAFECSPHVCVNFLWALQFPPQSKDLEVRWIGKTKLALVHLDYNPSPLPGIPIIRTNPAVVQIECHYPRQHNVSSNALNPTWVPYTSTMSAQDILGFSLIIMNSDWIGPSSSNTFYLGDLISLQASVDSTNHVPLRLFVDNCVASSASNANLILYLFCRCLTDSKVTNSNSQFITPRVAPSTLQFVLDAFRFYGVATSSIFITCRLKVTLASQNIDSLNKACSYVTGQSQWTSVDGSDPVCSCCDTSCTTGLRRRQWNIGKSRQKRSGRCLVRMTLEVGPLHLNRKSPPAVSDHLSVTEESPSGKDLA